MPRRTVIAVFDLFSIHLFDVSAFQRFRHLVCRIELHSLYDRLALALRRSLGGKAIMADVLNSVDTVRIGFTTESVQSTTAFSATFVAVGAPGGASWNQTQFACCTVHRAYPPCSLCARGVCSRSTNNSSRDVKLLPTPLSKEAPERGFVLMWMRKRAVDRTLAAVDTALAPLNRAVGALSKRLPP